jgi:hypothetical protein
VPFIVNLNGFEVECAAADGGRQAASPLKSVGLNVKSDNSEALLEWLRLNGSPTSHSSGRAQELEFLPSA